MATLKIVTYGNPILREKTKPVKKIDATIKTLVRNMIETMHKADGIGLAAPQIGKSLALFVVDISPIEEGHQPMVFMNVEILSSKGNAPYKEGCLSIPGVYADVHRPEKIKLRYMDMDGKTHEVAADGLLARVIQHENDHINGKLFIDYLDEETLAPLRPEIEAIEAKYKKPTVAKKK
ncbi:peptide deformylase [bacterium]|nr:peptide deformylase [bacterium]NUN44468.1 peptide deformylase [bacterium]